MLTLVTAYLPSVDLVHLYRRPTVQMVIYVQASVHSSRGSRRTAPQGGLQGARKADEDGCMHGTRDEIRAYVC